MIGAVGALRHAATLLAVVGILGCASQQVNLSSHAQGAYDPSSRQQISSRGCGFQLFSLIPIVVNSRADRAYRALVEQAPDSYITDVKVSERWTYAYVGTVFCTQLDATAYRRR